MSLKAEIAELRDVVDRLRAAKPAAAVRPSDGNAGKTDNAGTPFEAIVDAVKATMSELDGEIERFPHLAAITAFGIGVCFGLALSPRGPKSH